MTYALTIEVVRKLDPCAPDFRRVEKLLPKRRKLNAADARDLGCTYDDIIWIASAVAMGDEGLARHLTHFVNDNAKAVLHIFENQAPVDDRPRKAVEACDKFLAGQISEGEWGAAAWDAWDDRVEWNDPVRVSCAEWSEAAWNFWATRGEWGGAAWAIKDAKIEWGEAAMATRDVWVAKAAGTAGSYWAAFCEWQFDRLIYWLTEDSPVPLPMPEQGTPALPEIQVR